MVFNYIPDKFLVCIITLTNTTNAKVAFKLKSTQPKCYLVKPNMGIIDAGS